MDMNYEEILKMTEAQEDLLRFDSFTNDDAYAIGRFISERMYEMKKELSVAVRNIKGTVLYQHLPNGTNFMNQNWMNRKFNTVSCFEKSSLGVWAKTSISGEGIEAQGLDQKDFAFCGGGFPVRLKSGEVVGVITVSNYPHMEDHRLLVEALAEYLQVKNVPGI